MLAWEAKLDIQLVFNQYKAVIYMCTCLSNTENESSQAMKQAVKSAFEQHFDNFKQMKLVAHAYSNKSQCKIQVVSGGFRLSGGCRCHFH